MSHIEKFRQFAEETFKSKSWGLFLSDDLSSLSKSKLVKIVGIPRSAFYQDRVLTAELERIETRLRKAGIVKQFQPAVLGGAAAVDAIEQVELLDRLHQRLSVIEAGRETLHKRLTAIAEHIKPYGEGIRP